MDNPSIYDVDKDLGTITVRLNVQELQILEDALKAQLPTTLDKDRLFQVSSLWLSLEKRRFLLKRLMGDFSE